MPKKISAFLLFVSDFQRKKDYNSGIEWSNLRGAEQAWEIYILKAATHEDKEYYKEKAKRLNGKDSNMPIIPRKLNNKELSNSNLPTNKRNNTSVPCHSLTLPEIKSYINRCFVKFKTQFHSKWMSDTSTDEKHKIDHMEGHPKSKTPLEIMKILQKIGTNSVLRGIPVYVSSNEFDVVSKSLNYLSKLTGVKNYFTRILCFEDLIIDCLASCKNEELNQSSFNERDIQAILDSVNYTYNEQFRNFLADHITSFFGIINTKNHLAIGILLKDIPFDI
ncbi:hypothetical protein MXB_5473 [Myxobolus squamalis]|nr:hypothetical protein MXB_5473 [Myxobolus squamalis]